MRRFVGAREPAVTSGDQMSVHEQAHVATQALYEREDPEVAAMVDVYGCRGPSLTDPRRVSRSSAVRRVPVWPMAW